MHEPVKKILLHFTALMEHFSLFVVSAVHFASYLTGFNSMMLI